MVALSAGPDPVDVAVGARIRLLRKIQGLSQQHLADHCGVSFQQIQKYERGANRVSASMITKVAEALKVSVADLFEDPLEPSAATQGVSAMLGQPGALEMLEAFTSLPPGPARQALLAFARAFSRAQAPEPKPNRRPAAARVPRTGPKASA